MFFGQRKTIRECWNRREIGDHSMKNGLVSVIITNLNGEGVLRRCLNSLLDQTYEPFEILVVDNASTDASVDIIESEYPTVALIKSRINLGYSGGNNLGASRSNGSYLLFLDNDTEVEITFLKELVHAIGSDPKVGVVQSKILSIDNPPKVDSIGAFFTRTGILFHPEKGMPDTGRNGSPYDVFVAQGTSMLVRAEMFRRLGGFDDDYIVYFDDSDLCWRAWLAGYRVKIVPRSLVYHTSGAATSHQKSGFVTYHAFKNRLCSLLKNLSIKDMLIIVPVHVAICLAGSVLFLLRLKARSSFGILRALVWNAVNLRRTHEKRRRVANCTVVDRAALFPRLERDMPLSHLLSGGVKYADQW